MSDIDIMRREGAREPEDFMAWGYSRADGTAMSEIVKRAETPPPKTREARMEEAVRLILSLEGNPDQVELIELAPMTRKQLLKALLHDAR